MTGIFMLSFILPTFLRPVQLFCFNDASVMENGFYLENSLFGIVKGRVVARECAVECYAHSDCSSFGIEPGLHLCHLHKDSSSTTELSRKQTWKHSDISLWPKELMGPCADHTCPSGRRCSVHRVTKAPVCLEATVYQPDVCSEEPIPNAICSYESKLTGGIRSCTCHGNYIDVLLDVVSVNNTCIVNGSWTQHSINCTGPYIRLTTPSVSTYTFQQISASNLQNITGGTSTLAFLVKTCHDANFALHTNPNTYDASLYELVIGGFGNAKSVIRKFKMSTNLGMHNELTIVSCNEYRPFWVSWKNGVISVGKGLIAWNQTFMEWSPTSPIVINHISISTHVDNIGQWLFLQQ